MNIFLKKGLATSLIASIGVFVPATIFNWYDTYIRGNFDPKFGQDGSFWLGFNILSIICITMFIGIFCGLFIARRNVAEWNRKRIVFVGVVSGCLAFGFMMSGAFAWIMSYLTTWLNRHELALSILLYFLVTLLIGFVTAKIAHHHIINNAKKA